MQRNINDVSEVELNFMDFQRIGESIERLLRCGFEIFDNTGDLVNRRLIDQTARSINEQTNIVVKLNIRRKLHWVSFIGAVKAQASLSGNLHVPFRISARGRYRRTTAPEGAPGCKLDELTIPKLRIGGGHGWLHRLLKAIAVTVPWLRPCLPL